MTDRPAIKRIALIAHDNCKTDLVDWARYNRGTLSDHELFATGTTGAILGSELDLRVTRFLSGRLAGISRSAPPSSRGGSTSSFSSGIRSSHTRMTWT